VARSDIDASGMVFVHGELWQAHAGQAIADGQKIRVNGVDGLRLSVEPMETEKGE
jgi:membrane-bound serine protease (ClpP class)